MITRDCGGCTVCCEALPIDDPALRKSAGVLCAHCTRDWGCSIYVRRPQACRAFSCGWRELELIPESLRPDQSGLLAVADTDDLPAAYAGKTAIKFVVTGQRASIQALPFLECLAGLVHGGAPVFIAVPGPPGHFFAKAFVNERLADAVARQDAREMVRVLDVLLDALARGPFEPE